MSETRSPRVPGQDSPQPPTRPEPVEGRPERGHINEPCARCGGYDGQFERDPFTGVVVHKGGCLPAPGQHQGQTRLYGPEPPGKQVRPDGKL